MTTGEKIKAARLDKNLTQKQLGERCGMADSAIRRYELGGALPKLETLRRIAEALKVPLNEILPFEEGMHLWKEEKHSNNQIKENKTATDSKAALCKAAKDKLDTLNHLGVSRAYDYIEYLADKLENTEPDK